VSFRSSFALPSRCGVRFNVEPCVPTTASAPAEKLEVLRLRSAQDDRVFSRSRTYLPTAIKCVNVRRYIRPPLTAGVAWLPSPSARRCGGWNFSPTASTTRSPRMVML